jgi:hypothetical protein
MFCPFYVETMEVVKSHINREAFEAKYLGLLTPDSRLKADRFKAIKRCSAWNERFLSSAGKDTLIKSVAQTMPVYVMSVFFLPGPVHAALTR